MKMSNLLESTYYKYKDNTYKVLGLVKMKEPINRNWIIGVKYQVAVNDVGSDYGGGWSVVKESPEYVRSYDDFIKKFKAS